MKVVIFRPVAFTVISLLASSLADAGVQFNVDLNPFGWGAPPPPVVYEPPRYYAPRPSSTMVGVIGGIVTGGAMMIGTVIMMIAAAMIVTIVDAGADLHPEGRRGAQGQTIEPERNLERETRLELATSTLARLRSTN